MPDSVFLPQILDSYDNVAHSQIVYQMSVPFCEKLTNPNQAETRSHEDAGQHTRPPQRRLAPKQRPPETINDSHHGIKRIEQPPFYRHHGAAESNGGNVESKLHDERNDVSKIAVFYV